MIELDAKTKELVAIATLVAGNRIPCLKYHFSAAAKESCTKQEIAEAIEITNMVKQRPIDDINKLTLQLLGELEDNITKEVNYEHQ